MKKPDLIKQLANRINQPHVIESWINKSEKAAYKKGYEDAKSEQCTITSVVGLSEQLKAFLDYVDSRYSEQGTRDKIVDEFLSL